MTTTNNFRTIALALRSYVSDTYSLLNAADAVEAILPELHANSELPTAFSNGATHIDTYGRMEYPHEVLVARALDSVTVLDEMANSRKINAIKHLRNATGCGLKAAKEAVEDSRVLNKATPPEDPWSIPQGDPWHLNDTEPPF